jgi:putative isomerase
MNMLVWKGLAHPKYREVAEVTLARKRLVDVSRALLLGEWLEHHHVHENYNAESGEGCDVSNSNPFCEC